MKKNKYIGKIKATFRKLKKTLDKVLVSRFKSLSLANRIQFVTAVIVTLTALIAVPVYAWLTHQRTLAEMQRIKSPDLLYITAANAEAVKNLDMSGINVEAERTVNGATVPITHKLVPFCVAGDYVSSFTLQFVHTSNTPFKYEIYEGRVYTSEADAIATGKDYVEYTVTYDLDGLNIVGLDRDSITPGDVLYIVKGSSLQSGDSENTQNFNGTYLNMSDDNRTANTRYLEECYGEYTTYTPYELPLYWQCRSIPTSSGLSHGSSFFKTFIVDVSWEGQDIENNKETDMIYIMAYTGNG